MAEEARSDAGTPNLTPGNMPAATVVEFQAIDPLHSFFPMQVAAAKAETADLVARQPAAPFLVFAEDRTRPIKMPTDLPLRWVRRGAGAPFSGEAMRGEFYPFQIGVFAVRQDLADVKVTFSGRSARGGGYSALGVRLNLGGRRLGRAAAFARLAVPGARPGVWCGRAGARGRSWRCARAATVLAEGTTPVSPDDSRVVIDHPRSRRRRPWRLSRLRGSTRWRPTTSW
jgi:hypothetical protein